MDAGVKEKMANPADRDRWWPAARRQILRQLFRVHLPAKKNRRVLEAGCGPGWNLPLLEEFGKVTALELDAAFVANARATAPRATILQGSIPETKIDGEFDLICFLDVIEHLEDDAAALDWAQSMLAPGGCLCIAVPAFPFLWSRHDVASHHYRRYTMQDIEKLTGRDFTVLHRTYFNFWLFPFALLSSGLRNLFAPAPTDFHANDAPTKTLKNSRLERAFGRVMFGIFVSERHIVARARISFGVSAFVLVRQSAELSPLAPVAPKP